MHSYRLKPSFLLLLCLLLYVSCEKIESDSVPVNKEDAEILDPIPNNTTDTQTDSVNLAIRNGSFYNPFLPSDILFEDDSDWVISVDTEDEENESYWLCGYIVGYVDGSKMKSTVFGVGDKETNIVLCDYDIEGSIPFADTIPLMPVQLSKSPNSCKLVRDSLNLKNNPYNLHRFVRVRGSLDTYMGSVGVKSTSSYGFIRVVSLGY